MRHRQLGLLIALAAGSMVGAVMRTGLAADQVRMTGAASAGDALLIRFFDQYSRGEVTVGALPDDQAREFAGELRRVGPAWAGARDAPDSPRKRLVIATIALDFINQNFERAWGPGRPADLLEWSCELLLGAPAQPAERAWHLAAVTLLQRASAARFIRGPISARSRDTAVETHLGHAERRFPDDDEWVLARAVDAEHLAWPRPANEDVLRPPPDHENQIRGRLRDAFDADGVAAEAHLRWGYFHARRGRFDDALAEFDEAGAPTDPVVRFWIHLLRGRTLERLVRPEDAIASYRAALEVFPAAQSATLALGAALAEQGQATAAHGIVTSFLSSPVATDPWRFYGSPAQRHWPRLYPELRSAIAP
jgi:tetratricopeptide (TPR) repeat protein